MCSSLYWAVATLVVVQTILTIIIFVRYLRRAYFPPVTIQRVLHNVEEIVRKRKVIKLQSKKDRNKVWQFINILIIMKFNCLCYVRLCYENFWLCLKINGLFILIKQFFGFFKLIHPSITSQSSEKSLYFVDVLKTVQIFLYWF